MGGFMTDTSDLPISHLQRRKIEGRVLIPFVETLRQKLGDEVAGEILDATIRRLAVDDGQRWAETYGQGMEALKRVAEDVWAGGGAMDLQIKGQSEQHLDFDVTRCAYAEFYQALGLADIGYRIHCNRDHAMVTGFDEKLELSRSQTIMQGAAHCDFRYRSRS
jgi:L-2-amino-thiazoline-4-carboxylic acid hydrolase-like protein